MFLDKMFSARQTKKKLFLLPFRDKLIRIISSCSHEVCLCSPESFSLLTNLFCCTSYFPKHLGSNNIYFHFHPHFNPQTTGLGGMKPNTVVVGWPNNWRKREDDGTRVITIFILILLPLIVVLILLFLITIAIVILNGT